jgi:hypothetical protein
MLSWFDCFLRQEARMMRNRPGSKKPRAAYEYVAKVVIVVESSCTSRSSWIIKSVLAESLDDDDA